MSTRSQSCPLPSGFRAAGHWCGIKPDQDRHDLALFVSDTTATAAGVFTRNRVCGAPVKVSRERVPRGTARAVIISSGNANTCTGRRGLDDARWMTASIAQMIGCADDDVLVCSTGVIGRVLPRDRIEAGLPVLFGKLADSPQALEAAARGMMTTDTFHKQSVCVERVGGREVTVSGAAKGAGMIAPNMGTMLAVIMTDAQLDPPEADSLLREAVDRSFNCISVEGDTSTSDTVLLLANGAAGTGPIREEDREKLSAMIGHVAQELATAIIRDAEGARHFIQVDVGGLRNVEEARCVARSVAESALVKTAIAGADPNWGRIVCAVGYSGVDLREQDISLSLNGTRVYAEGSPVEFDAHAVSESIRNNHDVTISLEFGLGRASARFWTCDLTTDFVRLNSEYTT